MRISNYASRCDLSYIHTVQNTVFRIFNSKCAFQIKFKIRTLRRVKTPVVSWRKDARLWASTVYLNLKATLDKLDLVFCASEHRIPFKWSSNILIALVLIFSLKSNRFAKIRKGLFRISSRIIQFIVPISPNKMIQYLSTYRHIPPTIGVRDQFRLGGLRSVARIFSPLLARKSSSFARILPDFLPEYGYFETFRGGWAPPPPAPRLVRLCRQHPKFSKPLHPYIIHSTLPACTHLHVFSSKYE